MNVRPLPTEVNTLLKAVQASPRLIAHLTLVHDVAATLADWITESWPTIRFAATAVLFGAATHDIGKTVQPSELISPGSRHEKAGEKLLRERGCSPDLARFARTHGEWANSLSPTLEDLLVALADTVWKGKREDCLEEKITRLIADQSGAEPWAVWISLDDELTAITAHADQRLQWQNLWQV